MKAQGLMAKKAAHATQPLSCPIPPFSSRQVVSRNQINLVLKLAPRRDGNCIDQRSLEQEMRKAHMVLGPQKLLAPLPAVIPIPPPGAMPPISIALDDPPGMDEISLDSRSTSMEDALKPSAKDEMGATGGGGRKRG